MKNAFLYTVVEDLIGQYGLTGLGELTLVFPMQRAGLFVKQHILDAVRDAGNDTPVLLPHFTTIDALADSLSMLRSEDEILSICRLYQAYQAHTEKPLPLDIFYGWGSQLMTDFSNADMAMLEVEKLIQHSADETELDTILLDDEVRERLMNLLGKEGQPNSVRRYFQSMWASLPAIYRDFRWAQETEGVGTRGARSRWVIEHFEEEYVQSKIAGRTYVFVGFNYLLEAERQLMLRLREATEARFYWDYDPDFQLDESIYKFLRDDIALFGNHYPTQQSSDRCATIAAISCASSAAQATFVHDWLLKHHHPGERTGIVLADESMLQSVIYSLPRGKENPAFERVNVTKGYPLRQTRIYADFLRLIDQLTDTMDAESGTNHMALLTTLSERLADHYHHAPRRSDDDWQQVLTDEAYYQIQLVLRELYALLQKNEWVAQLFESITLEGRMGVGAFLLRRLESVSIPFHGEPITDIQLIGVLETRLLDFDNLLILNVEEGVVPNTAVDHSFIPYDLRKAHGMQTRDEEAKIYGYNFFRLLRRAGQVTMTFSEAATDMGQKTMSRFLLQLLASPTYRVEKYRLAEDNTITSEAITSEAITSAALTPLTHLSPSAICDYVECPRKFYYRAVRRIYPPDEQTVMFTPSSFGTLVHETIRAYYEASPSISPSEALDIAYTHLHDAVRAEHEAENYVVLQLVEQILHLDQEQQAEIRAQEQEIYLTKQLPIPIKCTLDRLDLVTEYGREILRVIDYKTGSYDAAKLRVESVADLFADPKHRYALQVLIYCMALRYWEDNPDKSRPIVPELIYPRMIHANPHLQLAEAELSDYVGQIASEFEPALREMVEKILADTEFPMAEEAYCCSASTYCDFHLLCGRKQKKGF